MQKKLITLLFLFSVLAPLHSMRADEPTQAHPDFNELFSNIDDEKDDELTRKIKKICKLCVGCLATDRLFVRGCEITCNSLRGATGPQGPALVLEYGYFYNLTTRFINVGADILLDSNGPHSTGVTHTPGTAEITVNTPGVYAISYSALAVNLNQIAIDINGTEAVGALYGTGTGPSQNNGLVLTALNAGDIITLRLASSQVNPTLLTPQGGVLTNVNAAVRVQQIANLP
ncbi:MAG: hypothetical protein P4L31_03815 [Candidatus Babeliales bacterium]|nr:hypothetical protein [Candidatus Babeliales bacterium]